MTRHYHEQVVQGGQQRSSGAVEYLLRKFTPGLHHLQIKTDIMKTATGAERTAFALVPGHGKHILRFKNAFIAVSREREGRSFDANGRPFETVKLTTLYYHRHIFQELFTEAHQMSLSLNEGKTVVYTSRNTAWEISGTPKRKRPLESVVLAEGLAERVQADMREFLDARTWYLDRGIPRRRGYLLHGPPGTGKTSFVQALAGAMDCNIAMLSLSQRGLTDDLLNHLLINVPPHTIVLLEDADAAFSNRRQQREADGYSGANVTYSGLLNALDGVASAEERVIFMTTNHIERLDDALIRPGRVDMILHLDHADEWQMGRLWDRFYADPAVPQDARKEAFLKRAREVGVVGKVSTAALQGLFLYNKDDPDGAVEMVEQLAVGRPGGQSSQQGDGQQSEGAASSSR
ncbi:mitochondrial chaperone BCS1 [Dissoconium aciculare CBS 342.82]|uniref:Mitochondrial chaperone BCS1 n=1 Tax=Dissoconium aciculare CBS 342.82 TaxID=1314786 RepID=A0A6J3M2X9_9PEZI|nr:mitochondrial chaperone BCS1 [Dissoconium aciculare CBS 342.82]KAF1821292.1 mitochondrial chaperone BCS1 [Dissoconium aciculare CBS 342.82]